MLPHGEEGASRVQKHIAQRAEMGFITLELPYTVGSAEIPADAVVLVEDVSNLLANAMFDKNLAETDVLADIKMLCRPVGCVIAVTISEFEDGDYREETLRYIKALKSLNQELSILADAVIEMGEGIPLFRKGAPDELF
jgi:adenosylcobinamide kinase/adenosylcobinamide-phosphate guanylyltransferase